MKMILFFVRKVVDVSLTEELYKSMQKPVS